MRGTSENLGDSEDYKILSSIPPTLLEHSTPTNTLSTSDLSSVRKRPIMLKYQEVLFKLNSASERRKGKIPTKLNKTNHPYTSNWSHSNLAT